MDASRCCGLPARAPPLPLPAAYHSRWFQRFAVWSHGAMKEMQAKGKDGSVHLDKHVRLLHCFTPSPAPAAVWAFGGKGFSRGSQCEEQGPTHGVRLRTAETQGHSSKEAARSEDTPAGRVPVAGILPGLSHASPVTAPPPPPPNRLQRGAVMCLHAAWSSIAYPRFLLAGQHLAVAGAGHLHRHAERACLDAPSAAAPFTCRCRPFTSWQRRKAARCVPRRQSSSATRHDPPASSIPAYAHDTTYVMTVINHLGWRAKWAACACACCTGEATTAGLGIHPPAPRPPSSRSCLCLCGTDPAAPSRV